MDGKATMNGRGRVLGAMACALLLGATGVRAATVTNPFLWADIPDPSIVRVDDTYYMAHTTMHMAPGVPIMKSTDLVNWKTISYCYNTLTNSNAMNLDGGQSAYGKGSWAASIRHKNGTFYVLVPSYTTNKTHLYSTTTPDKTPWKEVSQLSFYHDPSLWLDENGNNYVVYGGGDIKLIQLNSSLTGTQAGGVNKTIISGNTIKSLLGVSNPILVGEGSHIEKVGSYYYVFIICWPNAAGYDGRTEIVFRSKTIDGNYEGKVVHSSRGVAQGSVLQDASGKWWGYLFQDNGSVGRSPWIMPVTWPNDWPSFNGGTSPTSLTMTTNSSAGTGFVTSDGFDGTSVGLEWQWNHNPDNANWSLTKRPGYYRITTSRVDGSLRSAKNMLTQRSFGPKCSGRIALDATNLKSGDIAGLSAFQDTMGFVAVKNSNGALSVVQYQGTTQKASVAIDQKRVYLRVDMDFTNRTDKATFFYSLDSTTWKQIGGTLQMSYTLGMFMGYRFGLFAYSTASSGGYADFDWFRIGASVKDSINIYPSAVGVASRPAPRPTSLSCLARRTVLEVGYSIPSAGRVELLLSDASGRVAARVDQGARVAGEHSTEIVTRGIREGRYVLSVLLDGKVSEVGPVALVN